MPESNQITDILMNSTFTYILCDKQFSDLGCIKEYASLWLSYTKKTNCQIYSSQEVEVAVIGICVDSHNGIKAGDIAEYIAKNAGGIQEALDLCDRFAGKYIILISYPLRHEFYAIPDATATLPIYYLTDNEHICISSLGYLISRQYNITKSALSAAILKKSQDGALPYDLSLWNEVKTVLPNHYLDIPKHKAVRFHSQLNTHQRISAKEAAAITAELASNIVKQYAAYGNFLCPITSGYDSRLMLSLLLNNEVDVKCYTTFHDYFTDKTADVWVPEKITKDLGIPYELIHDIRSDKNYAEHIETIVGNVIGLNTSITHKQLFGDRIRISGDISGHIGKSGIGGALPVIFASTSYFMCKLHNHSRYAKKAMRRWLSSAKSIKGLVTPYDLFAQEIRCGRWAKLPIETYAVSGITELNILNCRGIISRWFRVSRKQRIQYAIFNELFTLIKPEMMEYPFNPGESHFGMENVAVLLIGTYAKHYWQKVLRIFRR